MFSDERLKKNIQTLDKGIEIVKSLRPISFYYKDCLQNRFGCDEQLGFLAQEVQVFLPEIVKSSSIEEVSGEKFCSLYVNSLGLLPIFANAIKNLDSRIEGKKINYEEEKAFIPASIIRLNDFELDPSKLNLIRGPLFGDKNGIKPYFVENISNTSQLIDPLKKIKLITPIINNGVPTFIPEQIEKILPEVVYSFEGKKCLDIVSLLAYVVSAIKKL